MTPAPHQPADALALIEGIRPVEFSIEAHCMVLGPSHGLRAGVRFGNYVCTGSTWSKSRPIYRETWRLVPDACPQIYPDAGGDIFPASDFELSGIIGSDVSMEEFRAFARINHGAGIHVITAFTLGYQSGPIRPFQATVEFFPLIT
jgi:hypothetical protein